MIGDNQVPVPTHLYKIVLATKDSDSQPYAAAFVVPNKPISREVDELQAYQVQISEIEKRTGFRFHPHLDRNSVSNLCEHSDGACKLQNWKQLEIYFAFKKLENAKSVAEVDNIVNELKGKGIVPTRDLLHSKERKITQLDSQTQITQPAGLRKEQRKA